MKLPHFLRLTWTSCTVASQTPQVIMHRSQAVGVALIWCLIQMVYTTNAASSSTALALVCQNGGSSYLDSSSTPRCRCVSGFTGPTCADADPCSANPCARGICRNNGTNFHCQCPAGYSGITCDTYDGLCSSAPCTGYDPYATCTESALGYTCSCSSGGYYGLNCEGLAKPGANEGCDGSEPESYCMCSVNGRPVKVPLPRPRVGERIKSRDIIAGLVGLLIGWAVGSALLALYHLCCYSGGGEGEGAVAINKVRPDTASSTDSRSTNLSDFLNHDGKRRPQPPPSYLSTMPPPPAQPPQPAPPMSSLRHAPSAPGPAPNSPVSSVHSSLSRPSEAGVSRNIYRAGFVDDMTHQVAHRKSTISYHTAAKDW